VKLAVLEEKYAARVLLRLQEHLRTQNVPTTEMVHIAPKTIWEEREMLSQVNVGDWVNVDYEYLPGTCSDGGVGVITSLINLCDDPSTRDPDKLFAAVKYIVGNRVEHSIDMKRLTIVPMPFKARGVTLRPRSEPAPRSMH
jgi:hypothetical protein